ncbi:MAG: hypothetical protein JJE04_27010 [Acidobacteriia bacterium]|nr:hypothetical protein [Terriglobia bacterium]
MKKELDTLKTEIEKALAAGGFLVYHGLPRLKDPSALVHWDVMQYGDPKEFLQVAAGMQVKLVVFHSGVFSSGMVDRAKQRLESLELNREDHREFERGIKRLRGFEGFTCALELSFDVGGVTYTFEALTLWYREFLSMLDELDDLETASMDMDEDEDEDEDAGPMGGYFSSN